MQKKKSSNRGMVTIEACFLIPMTIMLTLLLLWMGFFLYNKNLISAAASMAVIKGCQYAEDSTENILQMVEERAEEMMENYLILMPMPEVTVQADLNEISVLVEGSMEIPVGIFLTNVYEDTVWHISVCKEGKRLRHSQFVRSMERIRDSLSNNEITEEGFENGEEE